MTKAYQTYSKTFFDETSALLCTLQRLLRGEASADEANERADLTFSNLDKAANTYYQNFTSETQNASS